MKIKKTMMKKLTRLFIFLLTTTLFSQQVKIEAELTSIANNGLHKIKIPHTMRSYLQDDIRDFRIWDVKGNQVPYFCLLYTSPSPRD